MLERSVRKLLENRRPFPASLYYPSDSRISQITTRSPMWPAALNASTEPIDP
jgi:hypothetical protein